MNRNAFVLKDWHYLSCTLISLFFAFLPTSQLVAEGTQIQAVPTASDLKHEVKTALELHQEIAYTKNLIGHQSDSGTEPLFPFTVEKYSATIRGNRYRTVLEVFSKAKGEEDGRLTRSESIFLPNHSKELVISQSTWTYIPITKSTFGHSLLTREDWQEKLNTPPDVLLDIRPHDIHLEIPFLTGRFPEFGKSPDWDLIDQIATICAAKHAGLDCWCVKISRPRFDGEFYFCPERRYSIVKWQVRQKDEAGNTIVRHAEMDQIDPRMRQFVIRERYFVQNNSGNLTYQQMTFSEFSDIRFSVSDEQLELSGDLKEDSEVTLVATPQIMARWRHGDVIRYHNAEIVKGMSTARMMETDFSRHRSTCGLLVFTGVICLALLIVGLRAPKRGASRCWTE